MTVIVKKKVKAKTSHKAGSIHSKTRNKMKNKNELTEKQIRLIKEIAEKTAQLKEIELRLAGRQKA